MYDLCRVLANAWKKVDHPVWSLHLQLRTEEFGINSNNDMGIEETRSMYWGMIHIEILKYSAQLCVVVSARRSCESISPTTSSKSFGWAEIKTTSHQTKTIQRQNNGRRCFSFCDSRGATGQVVSRRCNWWKDLQIWIEETPEAATEGRGEEEEGSSCTPKAREEGEWRGRWERPESKCMRNALWNEPC